MSGLCVVRKPVNPDTRTWWQKLMGEPYQPFFSIGRDAGYSILHKAKEQNLKFGHVRHCVIGRIILK